MVNFNILLAVSPVCFPLQVMAFPLNALRSTLNKLTLSLFVIDSFLGESWYRILVICYSFITNEIVLSTPFGFWLFVALL